MYKSMVFEIFSVIIKYCRLRITSLGLSGSFHLRVSPVQKLQEPYNLYRGKHGVGAYEERGASCILVLIHVH